MEEIFHSAIEFPAGPERDRFLLERCGGDQDLVAAVNVLLQADADQYVPEPDGAETPAVQLPRFGAFQAVGIVGSGGVGLVYRARRDDGEFEQEVAVKLLRPG